MQMQISEDYIIAPFLVALGSLIGRKRGLELRKGSNWIEFANLSGMLIGRSSTMKTPAMNAAFHFLIVFANRAKAHFEQIIGKYQKEHEIWQIRKNAYEEEYKKEFKKVSKVREIMVKFFSLKKHLHRNPREEGIKHRM